MRRHGFMLAGFLLLIAATTALVAYLSRPTTLRVAVGPPGSDDARLMAGFAPILQREKSTLRLKLVIAEDARRAATMLDEGKADLAVARSDVALPQEGLTTVVLRRSHALILSRADRGLTRIADLRGKSIGVTERALDNVKLLQAILMHYEMPEDSVKFVPLEPADRGAALRDGKVDAVFVVGSGLSRPLSDSIAATARALGDTGLAFLPIREAAAMAARNSALEASELVRGAFGGEPPRPGDAIPTVSITYRLMAARQLADDTVGDITRIMLNARLPLSAELPFAQGIEAPSTEKNTPLPLHPGAEAYLDDEQQSFVEKYGDWFYFGVMAVSILGSGAAATASQRSARRRTRAMAGLHRLFAILREARAAADDATLAALETEADRILSETLEHAAHGGLDEAGLSAYRLAIDQATRGIAERRLMLEREEAFKTA